MIYNSQEEEAAVPTEQLLRHLLRKSFKHSKIPEFPLASGRFSDSYVDCKIALSDPEVRELVGELILQSLDPKSIDVVGGLELGAYPVAIAVSDVCYRLTGAHLRVFIVRKEPKPHGLRKWVEGEVHDGDRALIVDDVVTSGKSTLSAVEKAKSEGISVVKAVAVVDREEGGEALFRSERIPFEALVTLRQLKNARKAQDLEKKLVDDGAPAL